MHLSPRTWSALTLIALLALGLGCRRDATPPNDSATATSQSAADAAGDAQEENPTPGAHDVAVIHVKGFGAIRVELLEDKAPKTARNFVELARSGFFEGTTFHRVIPEFMIQGGDPNSKNRDPRDDGMGGPGYRIPDELGGLAHTRGVVSMANTGTPNSAGSQFFICVVDRPDLDGHYTAFGRVTEGMDVVDRILQVPRDEFGRWGPIDRPRENVVIEKVEIVPANAADEAGSMVGDGPASGDDAPAPARETPPGPATPPPSDAPASP